MTYDPGRGARTPAGARPNRRRYEREGTGLSVALMLALMAAFASVSLWLYATNADETLVTWERPAATTGTGAQEPPLPNTPTPPTAPSPSSQ